MGSSTVTPVKKATAPAAMTPHRAERVAQDVEEGGAHVHVPRARQERQPGQVHRQADDRHHQHQAGLDGLRVGDALPGLVADEQRDADQGHPVDQRREDLQPEEPVGALEVRRAAREPQRQRRQEQRRGVGEHVAGVGEQRQRARGPAADGLEHHHRDRQRQGPQEPPPVLLALAAAPPAHPDVTVAVPGPVVVVLLGLGRLGLRALAGAGAFGQRAPAVVRVGGAARDLWRVRHRCRRLS
jgi:hypothetical protein